MVEVGSGQNLLPLDLAGLLLGRWESLGFWCPASRVMVKGSGRRERGRRRTYRAPKEKAVQ